MKFFLCTGYGDLEGYSGGDPDRSVDPIRTQGMCQGKGASPTAWTVTSISMIAAHKRKEHGAHFITKMSEISGHLVGGLYVDDTNLTHLDMRTVETTLEAHSNLQAAVINWGRLSLPQEEH
jgi:hypothetical protein